MQYTCKYLCVTGIVEILMISKRSRFHIQLSPSGFTLIIHFAAYCASLRETKARGDESVGESEGRSNSVVSKATRPLVSEWCDNEAAVRLIEMYCVTESLTE